VRTFLLTSLPSLQRKWAGLSGNLRGALWMLVSAVIFVCADSTIKYLTRTIEPVEIVFFRNVFSLCTLLPVMLRLGIVNAYRTDYPALQFSRAVLGGLAMVCIFYSLKYLPLADATAIMFSRTLWMIPCAVLFLGEAIRWRRWTATFVGFIGVVLIVRPGGGIDIGMGFALTNAVMAAVIFTVIKKLKQKGESNVTILIWHATAAIAITAIPTWHYWVTPTAFEFLLLIGLGIGLTAAHAALIQALACGEATAVTPFEYSRVVFAALIGLFFFAEVPSVWMVAGAALILLSGYYIAWRDRKG
jgi:drug/metabolite transporter (DMT)-like permease